MTPLRLFFLPRSGTSRVLAICLASCLLVGGACAADAYYTGYLGDVIDLHGSSNQGTQVYLFLAGPGLPTDGVTLTDISQRADQGQFTVVDLDSSGQWSMQWDTSRLASLINPGTYTVYVTQKPVDYSHLGSSDTYKTLSVYLKDAGTRTGSISSYALHLDDSGTTVSPTPTLSAKIPTPTFPVAPPEQPTVPVLPYSAAPPSAETTPSPASLPPLVPVIAVLVCAGLALYRSRRP